METVYFPSVTGKSKKIFEKCWICSTKISLEVISGSSLLGVSQEHWINSSLK